MARSGANFLCLKLHLRPPEVGGTSGSLAAGAERACPFPTTSLTTRREQACLFRLLDTGLHASGERTASCRGGIHAARLLGADTAYSFQPYNTGEEQAGGIYPAPTVCQGTPLSHIHFPTKRNGHACSACWMQDYMPAANGLLPVGGGHAPPSSWALLLFVRLDQTTATRNTRAGYIPPLQSTRVRRCPTYSLSNETERACPFPTTSLTIRREQACLFRLLDTGLHASGERTAPCRGGIHAARLLGADTAYSFKPYNTGDEHEGGTPAVSTFPAPTINQGTPLPHIQPFKRNGTGMPVPYDKLDNS